MLTRGEGEDTEGIGMAADKISCKLCEAKA